MNIIYHVKEGFWSVNDVKWIENISPGTPFTELCSAEGRNDVSYLIDTLKFYG